MGKIMKDGIQYGVGGITDASDIKYGSTDVESALNNFHKFAAPSSSGLTITVPNSYRGIIFFADSTASRCGQIILFSNGTGAVDYATVLEPGEITLTTGTNSLTVIPNAGTRRMFAIDINGTLTV